MASTNNSLLLTGVRGSIGDIVIKQYRNKTVICKKPDMSRVQPTLKQKANNAIFAEASAYAKAINNDPVKKAAYALKVAKGQPVFNFAIKEFYNMRKSEMIKQADKLKG